MKHSIERAIAGVTSGLINLNETVTWEARHFGILWRHKSIITAFEFPMFFADEMEEGAFQYLRHVHKFHQREGFTIMEDEFTFASPFGVLGKIVDVLILENYMKNLLLERNRIIKEKAEQK
jgi:ligand-binding SRPBCC domain-containing protein